LNNRKPVTNPLIRVTGFFFLRYSGIMVVFCAMSTYLWKCPHCGHEVEVELEQVDKPRVCPACRILSSR
jgi:DNA-directed RNA polymerase subunit RPC12/RpoP